MTTPSTFKAHILAVDDDPFFLTLIKGSLPDFEVSTSQTGQEILANEQLEQYDLIILDINLGELSGYELGKQLRQNQSTLPILYASSMTDLEARMKAYGAGGNDYIAKPFESSELEYKVKSLSEQYQAAKRLQQELHQTSSLVSGVQIDAANLQVVNRFVLHSSRCKDFDTLITLFFHTLNELDSGGVLQILDQSLQASSGEVSRLEAEIMELGHKLPRIHSFGKDRAYFGWSNCRILVRNIGRLIDTMAILMDALEICIERIEHEAELIERVSQLESHSSASKNAVAALFAEMTESIGDELLKLGVVSDIDDEDEEHIRKLLDHYREQTQDYLEEQDICNAQLRKAVDTMRQPSPELLEHLQKIDQDQDSSDLIELF